MSRSATTTFPRGTGMEPVVVHWRVVGENISHVLAGAKGLSPMPLTASAVPSWRTAHTPQKLSWYRLFRVFGVWARVQYTVLFTFGVWLGYGRV